MPNIVKNDVIIREKRKIKKNLAAIKYVKNIKKILFDTFDNYAQGVIKKKYSKLRNLLPTHLVFTSQLKKTPTHYKSRPVTTDTGKK